METPRDKETTKRSLEESRIETPLSVVKKRTCLAQTPREYQRFNMAFCGYKVSLCGLVLSAWGLIQLFFMAIFFYLKSPAFIEDLGLEGPFANNDQLITAVNRGFQQNAFNCLIAACLYIITLAVSGWQFYLNQKTTYQV
ncbi:ribonuclease kappa [Oratosquilla oratoria]|uniref:ribonuclease kappa n=1 Tax=Oratosquilla oratoria TaxID=337810 RepID=UPI003F7685B0